jgi:hypothetical protein
MRHLFACVLVLAPFAALAACGNDDNAAFDGGDGSNNGNADGNGSGDSSDGSDAISDTSRAITDACGCAHTLAEICGTSRLTCPPSFDASADWFDASGSPYNNGGNCGNECLSGCGMTVVICGAVDTSLEFVFDNGKLVGIYAGGMAHGCAADPSDCPPPECSGNGLCTDN